ncbi:MAG: DUF2817 domain-containing protein [Pseudomonadota bacterium]
MLPTASPDLPALVPGTAFDLDLFAADHAGARARFAVLAKRSGAVRESYPHPLPGPGGEALTTDTAWLGPPDAARVLVLQSGLHGVEAFAGSAMQCDALTQFPAAQLPADTAILYIHAINPWGFAWLRRCNEDGIDLNRNFIDFERPLPANETYDAVADALVPVDARAAAVADARLDALRVQLGQAAYEAVVSRGQYRHPHGFYYGGTAPSWSRRTLAGIVARHDLRRREVVHVDLHTGIGPYGHGELICDHLPDSTGVRTARRLFGPSVTEPHRGNSVSGVKDGLVDSWWERELGDRLCFVTLECGTESFAGMIAALRADHILHAAGPVNWSDSGVQRVKSALRDHFCPPRRDWRQLVLFRARQVIAQALAGMTA